MICIKGPTVDVLAVCRDLKKVLSLVEKLQSHTSPAKNQWAEASQLCHSTIPQLTDKLACMHTHTACSSHNDRTLSD